MDLRLTEAALKDGDATAEDEGRRDPPLITPDDVHDLDPNPSTGRIFTYLLYGVRRLLQQAPALPASWRQSEVRSAAAAATDIILPTAAISTSRER